jgi:hypothetical protein
MSQRDAPALDFYPERWLVGTAAISDAEQLSYLRLLCHQWTMDGLPIDTVILKRIGGKGVTDSLLEKFPITEGKRRNPELEENRERFRKAPPARFTVRRDLTEYQRRRRAANAFVRRREVRSAVYSRFGMRCVRGLSSFDICLDHVCPVAAGGPDDVNNLQPLCRRCNSAKGGRI